MVISITVTVNLNHTVAVAWVPTMVSVRNVTSVVEHVHILTYVEFCSSLRQVEWS